ncbi:MAG: hypothetical protein GY953_51250, partial [bacterium]|nr:hypothetical protein [bacterium]
QNFAQRRVPFEHPAYTKYWDRLRSEHLHIPTFVTGTSGPFLPGSALKGALRTALVHARANKASLKDVAARSSKDRPPHNPGQHVEERAIGGPGQNRLKVIAPADSSPVSQSALKIYLLRTATIQGNRPDRLEPRWKLSPSGSVEAQKPEQSTPVFAEMASPGTVFEGIWGERPFYRAPEVAKSLRWKAPLETTELLDAVNRHAAAVLAAHLHYARWTRLSGVEASLVKIEAKLAEVRARHDACILPIGWGGGFLTKAAILSTTDEPYREVLKQYSFYAKAIRTGL